MIGNMSYGQMRPKSIAWDQMEGNGHGKRQERVSVIDWCREQ
jgi:hypothetical protein